MKTKIFYLLILVSFGMFAVTSVNYASAQTVTKKTVEKVEKNVHGKTVSEIHKAVKYTCPMHPEVVMDNKTAKCPKCGMALVEKKEMVKKEVKKEMNHMNHMKDSMKMKHTPKMKEMPKK
ncbi:MAG: heavy metal-binding domain-containing protein [Paludibacter sp.]